MRKGNREHQQLLRTKIRDLEMGQRGCKRGGGTKTRIDSNAARRNETRHRIASNGAPNPPLPSPLRRCTFLESAPHVTQTGQKNKTI